MTKLLLTTTMICLATALTACQPGESVAPTDGANASATSPRAQVPSAVADASPAEATSSGGPKRADGFWESAWGGLTQQYCVGDGSEEKYSLVDELSLMGDCSKKEFVRNGAGWSFETVCEMMGTTTTQNGTISGDFRNTYTIDQEVTTSGRGSIKGVIVAKRLGDCPAPHKGGDLITSGMTVNMAK